MDEKKFREMLAGTRLASVQLYGFPKNQWFFGGKMDGVPEFTATIAENKEFLVMSVVNTANEEKLVEDFTKIMEYKPIVKDGSPESGLVTYECDRDDPEGRTKELQKEYNLVVLSKTN
jgi:hypothetical protein